MSTKMIPFGVKKTDKADVLEQGTLGNLEVIIYKRGTVHILDPKNPDLIFKKDPELFEKELAEKIKELKALEYRGCVVIPGCGDNDDLTITSDDGEGDFVFSLQPHAHGLMNKLLGFINKGKGAKKASKS